MFACFAEHGEDDRDDEETEGQEIALAWAPMMGLGVVAEYATSETTDAASTVVKETEGMSVSLVWQF